MLSQGILCKTLLLQQIHLFGSQILRWPKSCGESIYPWLWILPDLRIVFLLFSLLVFLIYLVPAFYNSNNDFLVYKVKLGINQGKDFSRDTVEFNAEAQPGSYVAFSGMLLDLYNRGLNDGITENKVVTCFELTGHTARFVVFV